MSMDVLWLRQIAEGEFTAFNDGVMVDGMTSKIWTERFQDPGDFEFHFADVEYGMNFLQTTALVTLRDTKEVMRVESHEIADTDDGGKELIVKGRSFETILERRYIPYKVDANYNKKFKMNKQYYLDQVCCVLAWNSLCNPTSSSVLNGIDIMQNQYFKVDNLLISNSQFAGPGRPASYIQKNRWANQMVTYERFMDFLVRGDLGVRAIRPPLDDQTNLRVVDVDTALATRGTYTHGVATAAQNKMMALDIYGGYDLSVNNTQGYIPVIFSAKAGHLDDTRYLTDVSDQYELADVRSGWGNKWVYRTTWYGGVQMKCLFVDGGAPDDGENLTDFYNDLDQVGEIALKQHRKQEAISTAVSPAAPYKYGVDYGLGDRVTILGEYGYDRDMIVSEFTRAQDDEGYREFPGLVMPNEL